MYEFAERTVIRYSGNKAKTERYSQLFTVSTVEAETMSNSVRKFSKLHTFMNFTRERFRWLRQTQASSVSSHKRFSKNSHFYAIWMTLWSYLKEQ